MCVCSVGEMEFRSARCRCNWNGDEEQQYYELLQQAHELQTMTYERLQQQRQRLEMIQVEQDAEEEEEEEERELACEAERLQQDCLRVLHLYLQALQICDDEAALHVECLRVAASLQMSQWKTSTTQHNTQIETETQTQT